MTFASPAALWLLTLAVPITLMHFYRGRVKRMLVPTLLFWDQLVIEEERRSAFARLRKLLALAAALTALAALTSALAGPSVRGITLEPRRVSIGIDTREAMRAGDRLETARARARDVVAQLGRVDEAALYDSSGLVVPFTRDKARVLDAIGRLPRDVVPGDWDAVAKSVDFAFSVEGPALDNVALAHPRLVDGTLTLRVIRHAETPGRSTVVLRDAGTEIARREVDVDGRGSKEIAFELDAKRRESGALLEAGLAESDAFPGDDRATCVVAAAAPTTVRLLSKDPAPHLVAALDVLSRAGAIRLVRDRASVTICDGEEPALEDGGWLVVGAKGTHEVESPRLSDWSRALPFHRRVDYGDVRLKRAQILEGRALVVSDKGPVATWEARMGQAVLRFGWSFRVEESDFALRPVFPLVLRDAIQWLGGEGLRAFPAEARTGATLVSGTPLPVARGEAGVTFVSGSIGRTMSLPVEDARLRIPVPEPALVKIEVAGRTEWVAANRGDDGVDLTHVDPAPVRELPARIPWWRDLPWAVVAAVIAAVMLLAEWLLL